MDQSNKTLYVGLDVHEESIWVPPSMFRLGPCMKLAARPEARKSTPLAISSGFAIQPRGMLPVTRARCSEVGGACMGESMGPGLTQLTPIPVPSRSRAMLRVSATTAPFEAV
jgi:hypothetical protein